MSEQIWIIGKFVKQIDEYTVAWEILGAFREEESAIKACTERNHFVGPIELGVRLSDEVKVWPKAYYPIAEKEDENGR